MAAHVESPYGLSTGGIIGLTLLGMVAVAGSILARLIFVRQSAGAALPGWLTSGFCGYCCCRCKHRRWVQGKNGTAGGKGASGPPITQQERQRAAAELQIRLSAWAGTMRLLAQAASRARSHAAVVTPALDATPSVISTPAPRLPPRTLAVAQMEAGHVAIATRVEQLRRSQLELEEETASLGLSIDAASKRERRSLGTSSERTSCSPSGATVRDF